MDKRKTIPVEELENAKKFRSESTERFRVYVEAFLEAGSKSFPEGLSAEIEGQDDTLRVVVKKDNQVICSFFMSNSYSTDFVKGYLEKRIMSGEYEDGTKF